MGQVSHFLGIEFQWVYHENGHLSFTSIQESFADSFIESLGFEFSSISTFLTPFRLGYPIDSVPHEEMLSTNHDKLHLQYQSLVLACSHYKT
jgi:hypothetical protein